MSTQDERLGTSEERTRRLLEIQAENPDLADVEVCLTYMRERREAGAQEES